MKVPRKRYTEIQKRRLIASIRKRLEGRSLQAALRLTSNLEQVPTKTLEHFWYQRKQLEAAAQAEEASRHDQKYHGPFSNSEEVAGPVDHQEPTTEEPARLLTDSGQMRCSRCRSTSHLEEIEGDFHCNICNHFLAWEPVEDYQVRYRESPYRRWHWMM